ncbi:MAG TPA: glycosyltransferase [Opitutaceae bacterium]|jgi:glycosyltransferase involved in cell wall biosynthesis|nr:glycosyltransferase [Opitutaceae bacterium]
MRLTHIVPSLEIRYGGPSKAVPPLAAALAQLGNEVELLTTGPVAETRTKGNLEVNIFPRGRPASLCPSSGLRAHLRAQDCDCLHSHGLWLRTLHYAHKRASALDVPLVIAPRGMMSRWSWHHHRWIKRLADKFVHPGAFAAASGWHATSATEADDISARGFNQPICVAPNGVSPPDPAASAEAEAHWREACPAAFTRPTALFYSRFHRKKRVLELIELWLAHAPREWLLLLVGIPQDYDVKELSRYVHQLSGTGRIEVFDGSGRPMPYPAASLFLLPSHSENFGLAVAEAMAHGLPVVVTDSMPWAALNQNQIGWCVPWEEYARTLRLALDESHETRLARGLAARDWVLAEFSWEKSAEVLLGFYATLRGT